MRASSGKATLWSCLLQVRHLHVFCFQTLVCMVFMFKHEIACTQLSWLCVAYLSRPITKTTKWLCAQWRLRPACASTQSDQSSLSAQWVAKDPSFLHVDSKDWSDWADAQADLSLLDTHSFCWFCHVVAHFMKTKIWPARDTTQIKFFPGISSFLEIILAFYRLAWHINLTNGVLNC